MKVYISSLKLGVKQISKDSMLVLLFIAPLLCGTLFKYIIPLLDEIISNRYGIESIISPYYRILDNLLIYLAPSLICTISSLIILEERDINVSSYLFVTPVGYFGYIIGRLVIPSILAFLYTVFIIMIFKLTNISFINILIIAIISTLYALASSLIVVAKANNKVEGFALIKLTGISFIGILPPYFISGFKQYIFAFLPSYWIGKITLEYGNKLFLLYVILGIVCSFTWIIILYKDFKKRIY